MRKLHIDFETFAGVSVKDVGVHQLVRDPQFVVTVIAWAFDNDPVQSRCFPFTTTLPTEVWEHVRNGGTICAHNTAFEYVVLRYHYGMAVVNFEQMECSMQRALAAGLPAGLAAGGKALKLSIIKDETKKRLMLDMSRPRGGKGLTPWHIADPRGKLLDLEMYCRQDVEAERALADAIPDLSDFEKKVSLIDARSNEAGVKLDLNAVGALGKAAKHAMEDLKREAAMLSGCEVTSPGTQTAKLVEWLFLRGVTMPDLKKETIETVLLDPTLPPAARRMLELRQLAAKSSVAKLDTMLRVAGLDQRARGLLQYAGAGRTLRWAGRMVQPQNLPRGRAGVNVQAVIDAAQRDGALSPLVFGAPLEAISRALRGCFVAADGKVLVSLDLAQIEARVVAWLAGQNDVVEAFKAYDAGTGPDIYVYAAAKLNSRNRQLGKVLTLACGYGMGPDKFRDTAAKSYGVMMTAEEARGAVKAWRSQNPMIKSFWYDVEAKVGQAIKSPGQEFRLRCVRFVMRYGKLRVIKPNGDILYYHGMRLDPQDGSLIFDGVNQTTKQWGEQRTYGGKLVENITQAVARDVMAEALVRIEQRYGVVPVMTVHDEAVYELGSEQVPRMIGLKKEFVAVPGWAVGLPIASDIKTGARYSK